MFICACRDECLRFRVCFSAAADDLGRSVLLLRRAVKVFVRSPAAVDPPEQNITDIIVCRDTRGRLRRRFSKCFDES